MLKKTFKQKGEDYTESIEDYTQDEFQIQQKTEIKKSLIWALCIIISIYFFCKIFY